MAINVRLQRLLDLERSSYAVLPHDPADRALDVARTTHVPERQVAKVVVMRVPHGRQWGGRSVARCRAKAAAATLGSCPAMTRRPL